MLPSPLRRPLRVLAIGAAALLVHLAAAGVAVAQASVDEQAVASYRLTMPGLRQAGQATERMLELILRDDGLAQELEALARAEGERTENAQTIADIVRAYDTMPKLKGAITGSGLTVREFVLLQLAMLQAALVVGLQDPQNTGKSITVPEGVSKENVDFVRANWDELQRMSARTQAMQQELEARVRAARGESGDAAGEPRDEPGASTPPGC